MAHNRKYVPGVSGLVITRLRKHRSQHVLLHDYVESLVIKSGMLEEAPFKWVGLMYRYGHSNKTVKPIYWRIDKKDGELPIAIELKVPILEKVDNWPVERAPGPDILWRQIIFIGAMDELIHVCEKYKLKGKELFLEMRSHYKNIPDTEEELDALGDRGLLKDDASETIELLKSE